MWVIALNLYTSVYRCALSRSTLIQLKIAERWAEKLRVCEDVVSYRVDLYFLKPIFNNIYYSRQESYTRLACVYFNSSDEFAKNC